MALATPWTVAHQVPLSMGFPRQEYWSGLPFPSPGDLPNPGIEPRSRALQVDSLPREVRGKSYSNIKKNQISNIPNSSDGLGPSFPMSELNRALAYVHSSLAQESSLCYTLICLCQADLGSVSMRDPLWETGVKASWRNGWEGWTDCLYYSS